MEALNFRPWTAPTLQTPSPAGQILWAEPCVVRYLGDCEMAHAGWP